MARVPRALTALAAASLFLGALTNAGHPAPAGAIAAVRAPEWHKPSPSDGRVFPVLLPADGRWLNWRDTFGAPRMRFDAATGVWKQTGVHQGIDIYADRGTPIVSMTSGVVENVGWTFYSGYRVGIRDPRGSYYFYAHLTGRFPEGVERGGRVEAGTLIGWMGSSGYGPEGTADEFPAHLHLGIQTKAGRWISAEEDLRALYSAAVARRGSYEAERTRLLLARRSLGTSSPAPGGGEAPGSIQRDLDLLRADNLFPQ